MSDLIEQLTGGKDESISNMAFGVPYARANEIAEPFSKFLFDKASDPEYPMWSDVWNAYIKKTDPSDKEKLWLAYIYGKFMKHVEDMKERREGKPGIDDMLRRIILGG